MTTFTYNAAIPNPPDDPGDDVQIMQNNAAAISNLIAVDHVGFNFTGGGLHNQSSYVTQSVPPTITSGAGGVLYGGLNSSNTWPQWVNSLGNVLLFNGVPSAASIGYTFLAGGIIMQWGAKTPIVAGGNVTVTLPLVFPNSIFSVVVTPRTTSSISGGNHDWDIGSLTLSSFKISVNNGYNNSDTFYWIAIGN